VARKKEKERLILTREMPSQQEGGKDQLSPNTWEMGKKGVNVVKVSKSKLCSKKAEIEGEDIWSEKEE